MSDQEGVTATWLPVSSRSARLMAQEDARELPEAKQAEEAQEAAAESRRAQALELYRFRAEQRGVDVSVLDLAAAQDAPDGTDEDRIRREAAAAAAITAVLADARRAAKAEDERDKNRASREGAAPAQVFVGEPVLHRSEAAVKLRTRAAAFLARARAQRAAERAVEAEANVLPLARTVQVLTRRDRDR